MMPSGDIAWQPIKRLADSRLRLSRTEHLLGGRKTPRHDHSILRRLCMRLDSLRVCARADRDAQLPLPGLPALQWRSFRFRLHHPGVGHSDHRHAEDLLCSCWQRSSRDSQLLLRLRLSLVCAWRGSSGSHVHPFYHAGQSIGVSAYAGHLDIQRTTLDVS
jgi:hypothetical protein